MYIWVFLLWGIASLMACWSFSLMVRWISEAIARKRERLVSQRSTKSFWFGLFMMFVCAGVSGFSAYMAVTLEDTITNNNEQWTTPISIIGGSVGVFGIFMLILGIVGDPARGRVRCPKCWYDMQDASSMLCPECGHTTTEKQYFRRTRRPRRVIGAGLVLLAVGMYPVVLNAKIVKHGPLVMMPTWVLINWWESLPEEWIIQSWGKGSDAALGVRIRKKMIPTSTLVKFGDQLLEPTLQNHADRQDKRRVALLAHIYNNDILWLDSRDQFFPPPPNDVDLDQLLRLCALDTLGALISVPRTSPDDKIISQFGNTELNLYNLVWSWILYNDGRSFTGDRYPDRLFYIAFMRSSEIHQVTSKTLEDVLPQFNDERFIKLITDDDKDIREIAFRLAIDTGLIDLKPEIFLESGKSLSLLRSPTEHHLGRVLHLLKPDAQEHAFGILIQWIESNDAAKRGYAVSSIQYLQNNVGYNQSTQVDPYHRVIEKIIQYAIHDDRTPFTDRPKRSVADIAIGVITKYNTTAEIAFPILLDRIARGKTPVGRIRWPTNDSVEYRRLARYWFESFADFANSEKPSTRLWIIENLPPKKGAGIDEQLNAIAGEYLYDAGKRMRETALRRLKSREAFEFIPEEYDANTPPRKP